MHGAMVWVKQTNSRQRVCVGQKSMSSGYYMRAKYMDLETNFVDNRKKLKRAIQQLNINFRWDVLNEKTIQVQAWLIPCMSIVSKNNTLF